MVKGHAGGSMTAVMRHGGDVGLIWWVSWADLVGLGCDCCSVVRGFSFGGEWVGASGS